MVYQLLFSSQSTKAILFFFIFFYALHPGHYFNYKYIFIVWMKNYVGPDQLSSSEAS